MNLRQNYFCGVKYYLVLSADNMRFAAEFADAQPEYRGGCKSSVNVLHASGNFSGGEPADEQLQSAALFGCICHNFHRALNHDAFVLRGELGGQNGGFAQYHKTDLRVGLQAAQLEPIAGAVHVKAIGSIPYVIEGDTVTAAAGVLEAEHPVRASREHGTGIGFGEGAVLTA